MGFYHAPLKLIAKLLLTFRATLLVFTAWLLLLVITDGICTGPGRFFFDFSWTWTRPHLWNCLQISAARGHKKGKELLQTSTRWIWMLDSCPQNSFLKKPVSGEFECYAWHERPVVHLYSYCLHLEHLLVDLWVFGRESLYLFIHYWAFRLSCTCSPTFERFEG